MCVLCMPVCSFACVRGRGILCWTCQSELLFQFSVFQCLHTYMIDMIDMFISTYIQEYRSSLASHLFNPHLSLFIQLDVPFMWQWVCNVWKYQVHLPTVLYIWMTASVLFKGLIKQSNIKFPVIISAGPFYFSHLLSWHKCLCFFIITFPIMVKQPFISECACCTETLLHWSGEGWWR